MDIEQLEALALADDRTEALKQLIPGSEDYYFHHCLDHEHKGRLDRVRELLPTWIQRHGRTARVQQVERRLGLLGSDFALIERELGLRFDHHREVEGRVSHHPEKLDPSLLSREKLTEYALSIYSGLEGFTDHAIDLLIGTWSTLNEERRRQLVARVSQPDHPQLAALVLADLADRHSGGFGSRPVHALLSIKQLEELARAKPGLMGEVAFVQVRMSRLQPSPDLDWAHDPVEREAYLERLWKFVEPLSATFNALKVHVLFHRLSFERQRGKYPRDLFKSYLDLPRNTSYSKKEFLQKHGSYVAQLGSDFAAQTLLPPVNDDTELVSDYLAHYFQEATSYDEYVKWISDDFLKKLFATTKILAGSGDQERWYSLLADPTGYQALKERVEIELAPINRAFFSVNEPVTITADVKNVPSLVVKVFEINTLNYLLAQGRDVDTSVDLDGLVASVEKTYEYALPALRRHRETFTFDALTRPGVFVVELIGNGRSSRALVRKGALRHVERLGAAGHAFTVLDEEGRPLPSATIWFGGREYAAKDGEIILPYGTQPGRARILLRDGALATIDSFDHQAESYDLRAGIYVDRESLIAQSKADIAIRPSLTLNGVPVSLSLLEEVTLTIQSTDRHRISAQQEVRGFALVEGAESIHTVQVPEDLARLEITLRAKVRSLSEQRDVTLSDASSVALNGIDTEDYIEALHLSRTDRGWVVYLLGKTGEPRPHKPISFSLNHRDYTQTIDGTLQTDAEGRVELGALHDVTHVQVNSPAGVSERWAISKDRATRPASLHARSGDSITLPWIAGSLDRRAVSLLERRGSGFARDWFDALTIEGGALKIGALTPGDYDLHLKDEAHHVELRVTVGTLRGRWLVSKKRLLETVDPKPVVIRDVVIGPGTIDVALANVTRDTRVHTYATRFVPQYSLFGALSRLEISEPGRVELSIALSHYVSGRDIGDEYRYILERRSARKFSGNMLGRPGLLLNPWAVRKTAMDHAVPKGGGAYAPSPAQAPRMGMRGPGAGSAGGAGSEGGLANLDFLPEPARVLTNLRPGPDGIVRVPSAGLEGMTLLRIAVVDARSTLVREVAMAEPEARHRDLRLRLGLDASAHFIEKKQVSLLAPDSRLVVEDITTSAIERFDTLAKVYRLFATLTGNAQLTEMGFILEWPKLSDEAKKGKFSEFACHELSFFLSHKDRPFFTSVIKPYLIHKKDKTFMDHYLIEDDLSGYLEPWAHGRLNTLEQILLAQRMSGARGSTARRVRERFELVPPDPEAENRLFDTAIKGSALETSDGMGFAEAQSSAVSDSLASASMGMPQMADKMADFGGAQERAVSKKRAKAAPARAAMKMEAYDSPTEMMMDLNADEHEGGGGDRGERDMEARKESRALFRKIDKTEEWAENNYYKLRIGAQDASLIVPNAFWRDYAAHDHEQPFLSESFARATRNLSEMMCALAVLDLPFTADDHQVTYAGARLELAAKSRAIVLHREIRPAEPSATTVPILVSQNYFRQDDRYQFDGQERSDKYVTGELLVQVVYLCQVVLTNPSSSRLKLDVLLQIPVGAMPVTNGFKTKGRHVQLEPHATQALLYAFYFPKPGAYSHFPVHVAKNEALVAFAAPKVLTVVERPTQVDRTSWAWISQNAEPDEVLRYLDENNIPRLPLGKIAWRMSDRTFYDRTLRLLVARHEYDETLWSYAVKHRDSARAGEYLRHKDDYLQGTGSYLISPLVTVDAIERRWYEHLEYAPLVNARAHRLGSKTKILNDAFAEQYRKFLEVMTYRKQPDWLAATYYMLLQDRVADAITLLGKVGGPPAAAKLQYDYLCAYVAFHTGDAPGALALASRHRDHPVDRWRKLFQSVLAQLDEVKGSAVTVVDPDDRGQRQAQLAATQPGFDLSVADKKIKLQYQNLESCQVSYYLMDIELLFSRQPFAEQQAERFSIIQPNASAKIELPAGGREYVLDLPAQLHGANVVVEVVAAGMRKAQAYYAHELAAQVIEPLGQVRISRRGTSEPVARSYVKVYAKMRGGKIQYYKDGYTDLRGCFDYATLSTDELDQVERFAILIMSEGLGAVIREGGAPKR